MSPACCMTGALIELRCADAFVLLIQHIQSRDVPRPGPRTPLAIHRANPIVPHRVSQIYPRRIRPIVFQWHPRHRPVGSRTLKHHSTDGSDARVHRRRRTRHTPRQLPNAVVRGSRGSRAVPNDVPAGVLRRACDGPATAAGLNRRRSERGPNSAASATLDN